MTLLCQRTEKRKETKGKTKDKRTRKTNCKTKARRTKNEEKGPEKKPESMSRKRPPEIEDRRTMDGWQKEGGVYEKDRKGELKKRVTVTFGKNENLLCFDKRSLRLDVLRDKRVYCVMNFS